MGDVGHGPAEGTFISGNILHIPGRTVDDPPRSSTLSAYDVFFTTDCSAFAAKYDWNYAGPDGACSGTTTLNGANGNGCPATQVVPVIPTGTTLSQEVPVISTVAPASDSYLTADIVAAHNDLNNLNNLRYNQHIMDLIPSMGDSLGVNDGLSSDDRKARIAELDKRAGDELAAILVKDPYNYDVNMDMAELKKSESNMDGFIHYINFALDNNKISESRADEIRKNVMQQNHLTTWPTPGTSFTIATIGDETQSPKPYGWDPISVYTATRKALVAKLVATYCDEKCASLSKTAQELASPGGGGSP
jgi:hypothetical protein